MTSLLQGSGWPAESLLPGHSRVVDRVLAIEPRLASVELIFDPADMELVERLLDLEPLERLRSLGRFARLRALAEGGPVRGLDLERLLRALLGHDAEFCVIGGVAAWLQGSPAVTLNLDVMPRRESDNADRLAAALNSLGVGDRGGKVAELEGADFLGWRTQRFDTEAGPVDVVPLAAGIGGYEEVATIELALGDLRVRVLTLDEVIASKEKLGRPKDLAALPALYATREKLRRVRDESVGGA